MKTVRELGKTLDRDIAMLKLRWIGGLLLNMVCLGIVLWMFLSDRVYVINPTGGIWETSSEARTNPEVLYIEADDHIRKFYGTFLTFSHIDYKIQIPKSYELGGNIIKELYNTLKNKGFYNEVVTNNYRVTSEVTETKMVGIDGNRMKLIVTGTMILENDFFREERAMNLEIILVVVKRVPKVNPHGLSIENIVLPPGSNATLKKEQL